MLKSSRSPLAVIYSRRFLQQSHSLQSSNRLVNNVKTGLQNPVPSSSAVVISDSHSHRRQLSTDQPAQSTLPPRRLDPLDLTFRDTKQAYKSKTTYELLRAIFVLKLSQFDFIVFNNAMVRLTL